jgi:hypothetical protein
VARVVRWQVFAASFRAVWRIVQYGERDDDARGLILTPMISKGPPGNRRINSGVKLVLQRKRLGSETQHQVPIVEI